MMMAIIPGILEDKNLEFARFIEHRTMLYLIAQNADYHLNTRHFFSVSGNFKNYFILSF